jgi:hypothetical protein
MSDSGRPGLPLTEPEVEAFVNEHLKDFHSEIGRIASVWAMLEFRMDQLIWHLAELEQTTGACLTTQMNGTTPRLRALKALMELRGSAADLITKLNKFTAELVEPQEDRNRAIHDPWFVGGISKEVSQIRKAIVRNKVVYERISVKLEEVRATYRASKSVLVRFNTLRDEILAEPPDALLERRRKRLWRAGLRGGAIPDQGNDL